MGLRFRRSVKLLPGVRLNFSGSGVTTTVGPRGARVTFGGKRTRVTTGLPGTGISYTTFLENGQRVRAQRGAGAWLVVLCLVALVGFCGRPPTHERTSTSPPHAAPQALPGPLYQPAPEASTQHFVNVDRLNVRDAVNGRLIESLPRGSQVDVYETSDGWSRISPRGAPARWVATSRLCAGLNCYLAAKAGAASLGGAGAAVAHSKPTAPARQAPATMYAAGCPCSGPSNCVGPRGGRYCITSGGNKRYR
jgi:hypothetical protein